MLALVDDWGTPSPTGSGTEWFGFAGIFLEEHQIDGIMDLYAEVCRRLGRRSNNLFHSRDLNLNNKYHINQLLAHSHPDISVVAVRIQAVTSSRLRQPGWAYRYYAKEAIRSATHFADDVGELATVIFHRHSYLEDIEQYIRDKLQFNSWYLQKPLSSQIKYDKLIDVKVADDEQEPLLCFADCVAHACHMALNPDRRWQQVNPSCLNILADCIWQGPSGERNPRLFGVQLEPDGIPIHLRSSLPAAIRQHWE